MRWTITADAGDRVDVPARYGIDLDVDDLVSLATPDDFLEVFEEAALSHARARDDTVVVTGDRLVAEPGVPRGEVRVIAGPRFGPSLIGGGRSP